MGTPKSTNRDDLLTHEGFQKRSRGGEVELDLQVSPEEIMSREVEPGCESWTSFASSCSSTASATDIVLVTLPKHGS